MDESSDWRPTLESAQGVKGRDAKEEREAGMNRAYLKDIIAFVTGNTVEADEILDVLGKAGLSIVPSEPTPEMLDAYLKLYPSLKMGIKAGDILREGK
jgi:hypothetical protein